MHILIIGSDSGRLTAAALLTKTGHKVTVLEASSKWGGCAGKFKRRHALFPMGATLGMGFEKGGLHERVLRLLNKQVSVRLLDIYHEGAYYYVEGGLYRADEALEELIEGNGDLLKKNRRIMCMKKTAAGPLLTTAGMNTTQSMLYLMGRFSSFLIL